MKKLILPILAIAVALSACKKSDTNEPAQMTMAQVVGLWGLSANQKADTENHYSAYVRFKPDSTFEYYKTAYPKYAYQRGTYSVRNSRIVLIYEDSRSYQDVDNIMRVMAYFRKEWRQSAFLVKVLTDRMITTDIADTPYLHSAQALPKEWNEELSAAEKPVSEEALLGSWNWVSSFITYSDGSSKWLSTDEPDKRGITLLADNGVTDDQFWLLMLGNHLHASGDIADDERIFIYYADCPWYFRSGAIVMTCAKYAAQKTDAAGNIIAQRVITPDEPIAITFSVYSITDYYLVLYEPNSKTHYAFHRRAAQSSQVPPVRFGVSRCTPSEILTIPTEL